MFFFFFFLIIYINSQMYVNVFILCFFFSGPKPVFHSVHRKLNNQRSQQEQITPQHEELIKYIYDCKSKIFIFRHQKRT
jgi:hypothetical protein